MEEIWKDIPHYEGLYLASNLGRIKSLERVRSNWVGGMWVLKEKIMSTHLNQDHYECTNLTDKAGKRKSERVHRLVALAFVPNDNNLPEVNHINGIRDDNRVENLEWVSHEDNHNLASQLCHLSKYKVLCIDTGEVFATSKKAAEKNGGDEGNIRKACRDNYKCIMTRTVYGHQYTYINNDEYYKNLNNNNLGVSNNGTTE